MDSPSEKPKRRVRYKGTHPRKFAEKYKELDPERYAEEIAKLHSKGKTPAGTHRPICLDEILKILNPRPGQVFLDATLGYGGHSQEILKKISPGGKLIALDQDPIERPKTEARLRSKMV
jgi:16S rRNA (cytosine1402-N4)-methyltransferase